MNPDGTLNHKLTADQKSFLEAHEELHRQFGRLPRPARVAQDVVINPIIFDASGSMTSIAEDNSGSMGGTDMTAIMAELMKPPPYSGKRHMIIITDGETQQSSLPKPKYEKFKSNEAMIEEKLLTGRNRRSNKDIADVRREARRLNKKLKVQLKKRMKQVRSVQSFTV